MSDQPEADAPRYAHANCAICGKSDYVTPLHDDAGGPMCCLLCKGQWHAEHGRRMKAGRVVIRAMKGYEAAGGNWLDFDKLKLSVVEFGELDPLGYLAGKAKIDNAVIDLTSELLTDVLKLTHPDHHPPERRELAQRVTAQLLDLQPFVFPAPQSEPVEYDEASPWPDNRDSHRSKSDVSRPPQFPCVGCADTIPMYYCAACRTEYDKRALEEAESARAKQRAWYARQPRMWTPPKPPKGTPKPRTARQERVANQIPHSNLINHWLSGLQIAILRTAYNKRVPGARGADVSHAELLAEIWGWKPSRDLRWTKEAVKPYRGDREQRYQVGDTRASCDTHGAFNHIPPYQRRAARASLSRALTRLEQRMLISFVSGTIGTYGGGLVLTPHGEQIARSLGEAA
jgi:hypothetical protein